MKALFFIAAQNLKNKKGDAATLFILVTLAAILLYTSLSVLWGMDVVLDTVYEEAHTADFLFFSGTGAEKVKDILNAQEEVVEYEASDSILVPDGEYRKGQDDEKNQYQFLISRIEEKRIGKLLGAETAESDRQDILLPYYMKAAEDFSIGDPCYITIAGEEYTFRVSGFVEDPFFATPMNISVYSVYIDSGFMDELLERDPAIKGMEGVMHKVRLKDGADSFAFENRISSILTKEVPFDSLTLGLNWKTMKGGVAIVSKISMAIILVFSLLLILVSLIIIHFSIRNYIERNLQNIGILQAAGYTAGQLTVTVLMEMGTITAFAVIAGILAGIAGNGVVGSFQGLMLGLEWELVFSPKAAVCTAAAIPGIVLGVSLVSGGVYRRLSVLESLRGGIPTHNFKKNYFGFDQSRLSIPLTLAGKNIMNEKAKNTFILCIVVLLSFSACSGFELYENFAANTDNLLAMIGIELGDLLIEGGEPEHIKKELENWKEVEMVLDYDQCTIRLESREDETSVTCDIWGQPELLENEMVVRGRLPMYGNEIMLTTSIAESLKVDTGDVIYVTGRGERMDYVVSGIDQKINNMGLKAMMTQEGAARLNGQSQIATLYVHTRDGVTFDEISTKIQDVFPDISLVDSERQISNSLSATVTAMTAICVFFVMITIFVVALVEVLLVKARVIRERRNLGLMKAAGFTTGQLTGQTMMLNLPVIALGAVLGAFLCIFLMEPLTVLCFSFCGIKKCALTMNLSWMAVTVAGILLVAAATAFAAAFRIRKIEPVKLLTED